MKKTLLLLLRISRPEYNNTLVYDHKLYMNLQENFRKSNLNSGQYDKYEGAILKGPNIMNHIKNGNFFNNCCFLLGENPINQHCHRTINH